MVRLARVNALKRKSFEIYVNRTAIKGGENEERTSTGNQFEYVYVC
jgi:hypothetical protein